MKRNDDLCENCPLRGIGLAHARDVAGGFGGVTLETLERGQSFAADRFGATYAFLRAGTLRIEALCPEGASDVIGFVHAGEPIVISHADAPVIATALETSKVCRLSVPAVLGRDDRSGVVLSTYCAAALQQAVDDQQRLGRFRQGDAVRRLGLFLDDLSQRTGSRQVTLTMSRSDIADYLAIRPESVSRALATLEEEGVIRRDSVRAIRLLDQARTPEQRRAASL